MTTPTTEGPSDAAIAIPLDTLKYWRELVDLNPADLAPRLDRYINEARTPPAQGGGGEDAFRVWHMATFGYLRHPPTVEQIWRHEAWKAALATQPQARGEVFDRALDTSRRRSAVELLLSQGYEWKFNRWLLNHLPAPATAAHGGSGEGLAIGQFWRTEASEEGTIGYGFTPSVPPESMPVGATTLYASTPPTSASDAEVDKTLAAMHRDFGEWCLSKIGDVTFTKRMIAHFEAAALARSPARVGGDMAKIAVSAQGVTFGKNCWFSHEKITGFTAEAINTSQAPTLRAYREWITAAVAQQASP